MEVVPYLPIVETECESREDIFYKDGIPCCSVCGMPLKKRIVIGNLSRTVNCICNCDAERIEEEKQREAYREEMRAIERLKDCSMMDNEYRKASIGSYKIRKENEKAYRVARKYIDNFDRMKKENVGILFYGPVGTGKSFIAACIANGLMEKHISVIMTTFPKILNDLWNERDKSGYMNMINSPGLLIIDDLGVEKDSDYNLEKVYDVIDNRVRARRPLILTTNYTLEDMMIMRREDMRCSRIYDRIFECCHPVEVPGISFRMLEAAQKQGKLKKYFE